MSLVVLLFGTLCGDYALLADIGKKAIVGLFPDAPGWIHNDPGRLPMVVLGLVIVFPLSCLRRIRQVIAEACSSLLAVAVLGPVRLGTVGDSGAGAQDACKLASVGAPWGSWRSVLVVVCSWSFPRTCSTLCPRSWSVQLWQLR